MGWHAREESTQRSGIEPSPGGVVGVGDKDDPGVLVDGIGHRVEIVPPVLRRDSTPLGADGLGRDRIDGEGVFAEHRVEPRCQIGTGDQLEDVVGTIA